ncbi:MAG: NUDIX domain-containing protein [Bryobacter sp.]|jgi:8-oxo-dGTP pyrophosphatase MutT (NUDIX family)|nr:NUDIX domain-containing protein [Bryobacter sp.]
MSDIHKSALLLIRDNRILLCRKRSGTPLLILPGGKIEPGESETGCLLREIREELGVGATILGKLGTFEDIAAGETARKVRIELYSGALAGEPAAQNEIAELIWFGPEDDPARLSPVLRNHIIPDLMARRVLSWPR